MIYESEEVPNIHDCSHQSLLSKVSVVFYAFGVAFMSSIRY